MLRVLVGPNKKKPIHEPTNQSMNPPTNPGNSLHPAAEGAAGGGDLGRGVEVDMDSCKHNTRQVHGSVFDLFYDVLSSNKLHVYRRVGMCNEAWQSARALG